MRNGSLLATLLFGTSVALVAAACGGTDAGESIDATRPAAGARVAPVSGTLIDGTGLAAEFLWIPGVDEVFFSTTAHDATLPPGSYELRQYHSAGNSLIGAFTVGPDHTVDYAASLDGVFSGRGTRTLRASEPVVTIDGSGLAAEVLWITGTNDVFSSSTAHATALPPGPYELHQYYSDNPIGAFTVGADHSITYASSLDGVFSGRGTRTLRVSAPLVTVDATTLTSQRVFIAGDWVFNSSQVQELRINAGDYSVQPYDGEGVVGGFHVNPDGTVHYDPALEGIFTGNGTNRFGIHGKDLTIDASKMAGNQRILLNATQSVFPSSQPSRFNLVPGHYALVNYETDGEVGRFSFASDGTVDYDATLDTVLAGRGTSTLAAAGAKIIVNAQQHGPGSFTLAPLPGSFDRRFEQTLRLSPGIYQFHDEKVDLPFTVGLDGTIDYSYTPPPPPPGQAPDPLRRVAGKGTRSLMVGGYPTYDQVFGIATHNSYWMNRSDLTDLAASGTQELIGDQLLHEHVAALEIDLHSEGSAPHVFRVYHTSDSENYTCHTLEECLTLLTNFQYAVPDHEVINVVLELKNVVTNTIPDTDTPTHHNFDANHTIQDLDNTIRNALGDAALYTPGQLLDGCNALQRNSLRACLRAKGWPTIDHLRGKFIFTIIGNWSRAGSDWAQYATTDIAHRVAFPMASLLELREGGCTVPHGPTDRWAELKLKRPQGDGESRVCMRTFGTDWTTGDPIPNNVRQQAFDNSVFWDLEAIHDLFARKVAKDFIHEEHGIIRPAASFEWGSQADDDDTAWARQDYSINDEFQMIMTDFPWHFIASLGPNAIPTDPSQRLRNRSALYTTGPLFHEPGSKLYFSTGEQYPGIWTYTHVAAGATRWWETTVSSTRHGDTIGSYYTKILNDTIPVIHFFTTHCPGHAHPQDPSSCATYDRDAREDGESCIRVMSEDEQDGMEICRQKNVTPGPSWDQEAVTLYLREYHGGGETHEDLLQAARRGLCREADYTEQEHHEANISPLCIGSMLAMSVENHGSSSVVKLYSTARTRPLTQVPAGQPGQPMWSLVATKTFNRPMTKQGFRGWKDQLLAGLRVADALLSTGLADPTHLRSLTLDDLPEQRNYSGGGQVVDLSY